MVAAYEWIIPWCEGLAVHQSEIRLEDIVPNIFVRLLGEKDKGLFLRMHVRRKLWEMSRRINKFLADNPYSPPYKIKKRLGLSLLLDRTSLVDRCVLVDGFWEPSQVDLMGHACRWVNTQENPVFLDVGSYWGLYSMLAVQSGVKQVHAFEADPKNHAQLQSQLFLNELAHKINVHHFAVSDRTGTLNFQPSEKIEDGNRGGTSVVARETPDALTVKCFSLDDIFDLKGATILGKLDVEGHEPAVLRGMARLASQNRVFLQVEEFPENHLATSSAAESVGLRCVHTIDVDRYYTNFPDADLEWLIPFLAPDSLPGVPVDV
jgi:FkbM family methyltransferase